jgi:hypothetical protein
VRSAAKNGERGIISPLDEAAHQVGVGDVLGVLCDQDAAQMPKHGIKLSARHLFARHGNRLLLP